MNKKISFLVLMATAILPMSAMAQLYRPGSPVSLAGLVANVGTAVWIIFTIIVVVAFVVSGVLFLTAQGEPDKVQTARASFIWGVVGVVVGIIAYSIMSIIQIALF